ncbi:MAG: WbqC family protein, partial [Devosia sp.]
MTGRLRAGYRSKNTGTHNVRICIIQSCYVPWKGFFDLVRQCDEYVIFDSVQYARRHWHNRNRIVTTDGAQWLTIPVVTKGRFDQRICDVEISEPWAELHWHKISLGYRRAPYFAELAPKVEAWFEEAGKMPLLTDINE